MQLLGKSPVGQKNVLYNAVLCILYAKKLLVKRPYCSPDFSVILHAKLPHLAFINLC